MSGWIIGAGLVLRLVAWLATALQLARVRRQLWASREAFAVLSRWSPVGILRSDARGMCTFANETWLEISGLSPEQTLGHSWARAVHPDDLPMVMQKWEESVRSRANYINEVRILRPDGGVRHVLAGAGPVCDHQGQVTGFIGTVLDVTDRLTAEREARAKDSLLQTLVDHSSAAIYLKDLAGRYLLVNRRHREIWPAMQDFRSGTTPFDWFPAEVARSFIESDTDVRRTGETKTFEETIPIAGAPRTFLTVKFPIRDEAGAVFAVGGISADISELAQARRDLSERAQLLRGLIELQENEKQLLCHEFHDGLIQYAVGSKMRLEAIRERDLPRSCREAIGSVIEYLAKGIEDGRRVILGIRPAALDDLGLRAALDELAASLREAGIGVEVAFDEGIDAIPRSMQTTVYRIVQESLTNARKHSGSPRVRVTVTPVDGSIDIVVEDFGRGFDPAAADGGFGLVGLRERARLAGGTLEVDAAPGRGTLLVVRLPVPAAAPRD